MAYFSHFAEILQRDLNNKTLSFENVIILANKVFYNKTAKKIAAKNTNSFKAANDVNPYQKTHLHWGKKIGTRLRNQKDQGCQMVCFLTKKYQFG
jgi:hypothetical protein